jgi:hypothetical protein
VATIKESVDLFEDEIIVREYHAIDRQYFPLISPRWQGRIAITNRRVIGRSEESVLGGKRVRFNAVPLDKVEGTCLAVGHRMSVRLLIVGIIVVLSAVSMLPLVRGPGIIGLIAGLLLIVFAFRREVEIGIRASGIVRGGFVGKAESRGYLLLQCGGFAAFRVHGPDIDAAMRALDAVILAVQQRGADIVKDLKCPNPACGYMTMIDDQPPKHCPECGKAWRAK